MRKKLKKRKSMSSKILSVAMVVLLAGSQEMTAFAAESGMAAAVNAPEDRGAAKIRNTPKGNTVAAEIWTGRTAPDEANTPENLVSRVAKDMEWPGKIFRTMLTQCIINVSGDDEGMHIGIFTGTVGAASVLGIKDVKIQKKNWLGLWSTVATSSGGESYDCATTSVNILYANAEKGATYRILCVHYGDVNGYTEGEHDSGEFVFTY